IAASASAFEQDQQRSLASGCNDFISKPIQAQELLQRLQQHLGLEWVYETEGGYETREATGEKNGLSLPPASLVSLYAPEMAALHQSVLIGDIRGILEQAEKLEQLDEQWVSFATQLRQFAKTFQVKKIQDLLKRCMESEG
ncbi:MAG: hybrid sensor histidine kinase/response regulator, partial [Coleofasciculus sp. S288]|nr:hybrid sensor histidine kinase/response regulator [Coleofasciculus sp. S288]